MHGPIQTREKVPLTCHNIFAFFAKMTKRLRYLHALRTSYDTLYGCSFLPARRQLVLRIRLRKEGWKREANIKGSLSGEKSGEKKSDCRPDGTVEFLFYFDTIRTSFTYHAEETSPDMITAQLDRWGQLLFLRCTDSVTGDSIS
jgi:hypothetical protein